MGLRNIRVNEKKIQMEFWVLTPSSHSVPPQRFNILHWGHQEMLPTLKHKEEMSSLGSYHDLIFSHAFPLKIPQFHDWERNTETLWILSLKCLYSQQTTEWNPLKKCWGPKGNRMTNCHSSKKYTVNLIETFLHKLRKLSMEIFLLYFYILDKAFYFVCGAAITTQSKNVSSTILL